MLSAILLLQVFLCVWWVYSILATFLQQEAANDIHSSLVFTNGYMLFTSISKIISNGSLFWGRYSWYSHHSTCLFLESFTLGSYQIWSLLNLLHWVRTQVIQYPYTFSSDLCTSFFLLSSFLDIPWLFVPSLATLHMLVLISRKLIIVVFSFFYSSYGVSCLSLGTSTFNLSSFAHIEWSLMYFSINFLKYNYNYLH